MVKRLVFDLDNSIFEPLDKLQVVFQALNKYNLCGLKKAKQLLVELDQYEKLNSFYSREQFLKFCSDRLYMKFDERFLNILFDEIVKATTSENDGIKSMLESLNRYEVVAISNFFKEVQMRRLVKKQLDGYFSEYYGETALMPGKYIYLAASNFCNPKECVFIGSNKKHDYDVPRSLGYKTIYINPNSAVKKVENITPQLIRKL